MNIKGTGRSDVLRLFNRKKAPNTNEVKTNKVDDGSGIAKTMPATPAIEVCRRSSEAAALSTPAGREVQASSKRSQERISVSPTDSKTYEALAFCNKVLGAKTVCSEAFTTLDPKLKLAAPNGSDRTKVRADNVVAEACRLLVGHCYETIYEGIW